MDPAERLERIEQLKAEADEGRERIRQRQEERERDPTKMDDFMRSERYVAREAMPGELVYKDRRDALVTVGTDDAQDAVNQAGWDRWLLAHLSIERRGLIDAIEQDVNNVAASLRSERDAGEAKLQREITELRRVMQEREERAGAIAEVKKQLTLERDQRERTQFEAALVQRDARIAALEDKLQMLLRFLSVSGYDLPRGM
jgi:hypothetical protein